MPAPKGHKKWGGRKKDSKNKKTLAWERLGEFLSEDGADRAKDIIMSADNKDFMLYFDKLLEYFKPKLQRTDFQGEIEHKFNELNYNGNYLPSDAK
jgi:hypothetical protein